MSSDNMGAGGTADSGSILTGVFDRVDSMLRPEAEGGFSAREAPATAAIRAAAKAFGAKPAPGIAPAPDEPIGSAIARIARSAGLIAREMVLTPDWQRAVALPLIVIRKSDKAPLAFLPHGSSWRVVDGSAPRRPVQLQAHAANDIETRAWVLGPALPDKAIKTRDLFLYGFQTKVRDLSAYALMSALAGLALACVPISNIAVTDIVIPGRDLTLLNHIIAMLLALMLASLATRLSAALCQLRIDGRTGSMLRAAAADRMIRLQTAPNAKPLSPAAAALITRCVETWHRGMWHLALTIVAGLLVALPSLIVMMRVAPLGAGLALSLMIAAIAISALIVRKQIATLFGGPCSPTSWISMSFEALAQIVTVRALAAEQRMFKLFAESFLGLKDRFLACDRMGAWIHALEHALEAIVIAVAIATVVLVNQKISANDSVAFTMAVMTVAGAAVTIVHGFTQASMLGLQERMIEPVLQGTPAPATSGGMPGSLMGEVSVRGVVVQHGANGVKVLDGIDLDISPGQHIGVVGASGSGKTTLINALIGVVKPTSGSVMYDGSDLATVDAAAVRRQIGIVGQAGRLFPGTLLDNIAAGLPLSQQEAWEALSIAALDDDVRQMPLGLATPIGDADPVLSTGQVQRLLIARAVAQRPKILILDEATSALDPATEARVAAALDALQATVISVAHRLETLAHCDVIHVLEAGRIVEAGSFSNLQASGGALAAMVAANLRAAGEEGEPESRDAQQPEAVDGAVAQGDARARIDTLLREFQKD